MSFMPAFDSAKWKGRVRLLPGRVRLRPNRLASPDKRHPTNCRSNQFTPRQECRDSLKRLVYG
jgi:hypothetical protein